MKTSNNNFSNIKDVARVSGFSINTVSRALNDKGYVAKETKEKILKVAEELNYVKNTTAYSLRSSVTKTIGVVVVDNSNPFYAEVLKGMQHVAEEKGYQILFANTNMDSSREKKAIQTLLQRRVDGLIISSVQSNHNYIIDLYNKKVPMVFIESIFDEIKNVSVCINNEKGGYIATKHLIEKGRKNIYMVTAPEYKLAAKNREEGFKTALDESGLLFDKKYLIRSGEGYDNAYKTIEENFKDMKDCDAIFCYNDIFAYAVLAYLRKNNIRVPEDIAIVGFDDLFYSSIINPPLTTVKIDKQRIGKLAFEKLLKILHGENAETEIIDVELIEREST